MAMSLGSFASRVVATKVVATDGTGDFTTIQEAIDALPSTGGVVYIKEGTYTITSSISINKPNVAIVGAGKSTKIQTTADIIMIDVDVGQSFSIEKIYLYGAGTGKTNNIGIDVNTSSLSIISNCWIENTGSDGIHTTSGVDSFTITENMIINCFQSGIYFQYSGKSRIPSLPYL